MDFQPKRLQGKFGMLPSFAAAMAFYFLVSLIPFLVVVTRTAAWFFSANLAPELGVFLREVLPPESRLRPEAVAAALSSGGGRGLGAASTFLAVWTATSGMNELARAVHFVFSDEKSPHPGGWLRRLKSLGLLGIWTAAIGSAAILLVLLPVLRTALARLGAGFDWPKVLAAAVRYPVAVVLMFAAFTLTYAFIPEPEHRPGWRAAGVGGAVAATAWTATCLVFSFLLPRAWGANLFHGVLGSALATLAWAYCGCWGILIGAGVAAVLDE